MDFKYKALSWYLISFQHHKSSMERGQKITIMQFFPYQCSLQRDRASEDGNAKCDKNTDCYPCWQKKKKKNRTVLEQPLQQCSLLVCGVMWISGAGALLSSETSRKSLWGRRGREQGLATSARCSERQKIQSRGGKGIDFSWGCAKMWIEEREKCSSWVKQDGR